MRKIKDIVFGISKPYNEQQIPLGQITAEATHTLYRHRETTATWAWGQAQNGALGNGSAAVRCTPNSVLGGKTFCKINAGATFSGAINNSGQVFMWGLNSVGQLGLNTAGVGTCRSSPVAIAGILKTFCEIALGSSHTIAVDKNGLVWGWGLNNNGQIGDNTIVSKRTPVSILGATKTFCKIAAGGPASQGHSLAIDKNGRVWGWGINNFGQLGDGTNISKLTPVSILGSTKTFCHISTNICHTAAIDKNGKVWTWGGNGGGQLGDGTLLSKTTPVGIGGTNRTFCKISAGGNHTAAIDRYGTVWSWGNNSNSQLGTTEPEAFSSTLPVSVGGTKKTFCEITTGTDYTVAIEKNGTVWAWGLNSNGQLGDAIPFSVTTPITILGSLKTFCKIFIGYPPAGGHTVAIDKNGRAWSWGANNFSQLGNGGVYPKLTPVSVIGNVKTFCDIKAGYCHTIAIDKNGGVWTWGLNNNGQLGNNTITSERTPVSILGATKTFCKIAGGYLYSVAIDKNGRAWAWGINSSGELGINSTASQRTPVSVLGAVKTFCKIISALGHTMAIDKNGLVWGWGLNGSGQLGDNTIVQKLTPVSVGGTLKTFCEIAAGSCYTVAIDKNGRAWAWGINLQGQLGNNLTASQRTPVSVLGAVKTFCKIAAAQCRTFAIDKNGGLWGWGIQFLGDAGFTSRRTPVSIGPGKTFCEIVTSANASLAIDKNGSVWTWGQPTIAGGAMAIGKGTAVTPIRVCTI